MKFRDIDVYAFGNTIHMVGSIFAGDGRAYLCFLPEEGMELPLEALEMDTEDWKTLIRQTDLMETPILQRTPDGALAKVILRKSSRIVDANINWKCFRRDEYRCRYCGNDQVALTVDHLVSWEDGGPSIEENMLTSCRKCNKKRGNLSYAEWLNHPHYLKMSTQLTEKVRSANEALVPTLGAIPRVMHVQSR